MLNAHLNGWMDGCLKIETRLANIGDHSFGNVKCIAIIAPHGFSLCKCIDSRNCLFFPTSSIVDLSIEKTCLKFPFQRYSTLWSFTVRNLHSH